MTASSVVRPIVASQLLRFTTIPSGQVAAVVKLMSPPTGRASLRVVTVWRSQGIAVSAGRVQGESRVMALGTTLARVVEQDAVN